MYASALLLTLFCDSTMPKLVPLALEKSLALDAVWFCTSEVSCAAAVALTSTAPSASTVLSCTNAVAPEGTSPLKAPAISGSPMIVSTRLNSRFCGYQPIVLNASVTPTPVPPEVTALSVEASICAVLSACTVTSPSASVVTLAPLMCASAALCTTLVATSTFTAVALPLPNFPAEALVAAALSRCAVSVACSCALTSTSPPVSVSVAPSTFATAPPRTSFIDSAPDTPSDEASEIGSLESLCANALVSSVIVAVMPAASLAATSTPAPASTVVAAPSM